PSGERVRRITGRSLGTYFREEVAGPLGLDFHIGLPESEHDRVAELTMPPPPSPEDEAIQLGMLILSDPEGVTARAFMNPPSIALGVNHAAGRTAEIPAANGHATARALARVYGVLARGGDENGVHLLDTASIDRCREEQSQGADLVLRIVTRFGLGFMLPQDRPAAPSRPSP